MNFSFWICKLAINFYLINNIYLKRKIWNIVQCPFKLHIQIPPDRLRRSHMIWCSIAEATVGWSTVKRVSCSYCMQGTPDIVVAVYSQSTLNSTPTCSNLSCTASYIRSLPEESWCVLFTVSHPPFYVMRFSAVEIIWNSNVNMYFSNYFLLFLLFTTHTTETKNIPDIYTKQQKLLTNRNNFI